MRVALLLALVVPFLPAQAQLDSRQREALTRQETALGNLERAHAKGKVTLTQVANWKGALQSLRGELEQRKVPADHPQCVALLERVAAFETKLAESEEAAAAATWTTIEQVFTEVEAKLDAVQHERELRPLHKRLDEIGTFAASRPDDPRSQAAITRIAAAKQRGTVALSAKQADAAKQAATVDPANYPTLQKDCAELDGLFERFRAFQDIRRDPVRTAAMCQQWQQAAEFHKQCLQTYQALIKSDGHLGKDVRARIQRVGEVLIVFRDKAVQFQKATPGAVRESLAKAKELATQGQTQQRPAFFTGGVKQQLEGARQWLAGYAAIRGDSDAEVLALQQELTATQKQVDAMAATLADKILAEARAPEDTYRGADRAELDGKIRAAWAKAHPQDEVLGVVFHMPQWRRDQTSTYHASARSWQHTDSSVLCVTFLVRKSATLAVTHPAYLYKDHLSQDALTTGVNTKGDSYVSETILVQNLAPAAMPR